MAEYWRSRGYGGGLPQRTNRRRTDPVEVDPGELRHYLAVLQDFSKLKKAPQKSDSFGSPVTRWAVAGYRWGSIEAAGGREFWYAEQVVSEASHLIVMRNFRGLTPQMRIVFQGRDFEIVFVQNPGQLADTTTLLIQAKEMTT